MLRKASGFQKKTFEVPSSVQVGRMCQAEELQGSCAHSMMRMVPSKRIFFWGVLQTGSIFATCELRNLLFVCCFLFCKVFNLWDLSLGPFLFFFKNKAPHTKLRNKKKIIKRFAAAKRRCLFKSQIPAATLQCEAPKTEKRKRTDRTKWFGAVTEQLGSGWFGCRWVGQSGANSQLWAPCVWRPTVVFPNHSKRVLWVSLGGFLKVWPP